MITVGIRISWERICRHELPSYFDALTEQVSVHQELLRQISQKANSAFWNAAERSLQILAEAVIGTAKHANRKLQLPERSDAANSGAQLLEHFPYPEVDPQEIRGAIGMRNAIVYDYLNLDWKLIQKVISTGQYLKLGRFVSHCCKLLRE